MPKGSQREWRWYTSLTMPLSYGDDDIWCRVEFTDFRPLTPEEVRILRQVITLCFDAWDPDSDLNNRVRAERELSTQRG